MRNARNAVVNGDADLQCMQIVATDRGETVIGVVWLAAVGDRWSNWPDWLLIGASGSVIGVMFADAKRVSTRDGNSSHQAVWFVDCVAYDTSTSKDVNGETVLFTASATEPSTQLDKLPRAGVDC